MALTCLSLLLSCPASLPVAEAEKSAPRRLPEPGTVLERSLAGGEAHRYPLERRPGEELWLVVLQDGIDVTVSILGAEGQPRITVDSPSGLWGEEWLLVERGTPAGGAIEVRALTPHSAPGRYQLRVESRFPPELENRRRRAAERALTEAGRLNRGGTRETRSLTLEQYREALAGWQALGRNREAARTLFDLAMVHRRLDEPGEALPLLRRALSEWQSLDDRKGQAQAMTEIASTARMLGQNEFVESTYREALDLWRDLGDLHGQARTLNHLGLVRAGTVPLSAVEPYEEALMLFRRLGDFVQEGVVLNNLGGVHALLGEPHPALEHFHQALDIHQRLGDLRQQAAVWNNIASIRRRVGRLQEAIEGFRKSLEIRRGLDDRRGKGRVLNNLGLTWLALGDAPRARDSLRESLLLRRAIDDRRGEAITLHNLGLAHAELEEWDEALDLWSRALALHRALRDRRGEAVEFVAMGRAAGQLGRSATARRYLEDALAILEEVPNPWQQAHAWRHLGRILTASAEPEEAVEVLRRSLRLYRSIGDGISEGEALLELARAERAVAARQAAGRLVPIYARATAVLDLLETVRAEVDNPELRTSFLSHHAGAYEFAVDLAMDLEGRDPAAGWAARAFEISERARARGLLDLLQESGAGLRAGVDPALLERQRQLLERLNAKVGRRRRYLDGEGPSAESRRLAGEIREVRARLEELEDEIRSRRPAREALTRPHPMGAAAVRGLLGPRTILLEYFLGEERSFLWAVTAERIESFVLPGRKTIEAMVRKTYERLRVHDPRARNADLEAAARLSRILLGPLGDRLVDERLAIIADGALHYLPFAALPHPAASAVPLLARHEIVVLPSASSLGVQRQFLAGRPPAEKALAVLADPVFGPPDPRLQASGAAADLAAAPLLLASRNPAYRLARSGAGRLDRLSWSRWEAEALAAHAGEAQTLVALDFDANLEAVRSGQLEGYRIVHFATHGIVDSEHPELSSLVLSLYDRQGRPRDGFLRLPEIYRLDLDAELVVLSGCRTALGRELRGEGLVGLTRGFFTAGAKRLVASLWPVQDRATAELMDRFYRHLLRDGSKLRPAAALRRAQLELASEPHFGDPYHWAAFAIYGDWR